MKQKLIRIFSVLLIVTLLMPFASVFCANAQEKLRDDQSDSNDSYCSCTNHIVQRHVTDPDISTVEDYYELISGNSSTNRKKGIAMVGNNGLPSYVDNSTSPYFPEIGDQDILGSCAVFSTTYYQFTYTMNKLRNVITTGDNTFSATWIYNLSHSGNAGSATGTSSFDNYELLKEVGCPSAKSVPYNADDDESWVTDPDIWREAARYRLKSYHTFNDLGEADTLITSPGDADLVPIKTALSNGEVLTYGTFFTSWKIDELKTHPDVYENYNHQGELFVRATLGNMGGHDMTIVGYNDDIWCDVNLNNQIDKGEMGAFKVANSHGKSYCNNGYVWVAYDALNYTSVVNDFPEDQQDRERTFFGISRIEVCPPREGADIYAKFTLNTADRSQFSVSFSAEKDGTQAEGEFLDGRYKNSNNKCAFDGSSQACDATFIYPLDNLIPDICGDNFESCNISVTAKDSKADSIPLTIKDMCIVNEYTGEEYRPDDFPIQLNNSEYRVKLKEKTAKNAVIYYIGFDNPMLHYKTGDSDFKQVSMVENAERHGYLYKYVVRDITDDVTLYFSDDSGKSDDNNRQYYTATEGLNYYYTKNQREPVVINDFTPSSDKIDLMTSYDFNIDIAGGYAPYKYKTTLKNLTTGNVETYDYDHIMNNYPYMVKTSFYQAGSYELTIEAMDYAGETTKLTKTFEVKNYPFQIEYINADKQNGIVNKPIVFESKTLFEFIMTHADFTPRSNFTVKNSDGEVVWEELVVCSYYEYDMSTSTTHFSYTPTEVGEYTLTVSSTDGFDEYAEKTISFAVYDMIIGDTDGDGLVSIVDATAIQQHLADIPAVNGYYEEMANSDGNEGVNILDATNIQMYLADLSYTGYIGEIVGYKPSGYTIKFTNAVGWDEVYCSYRSEDGSFTKWPGVKMAITGVNEANETIYTIDVPCNTTEVFFNNSVYETFSIGGINGNKHYYPINNSAGTFFKLIEI